MENRASASCICLIIMLLLGISFFLSLAKLYVTCGICSKKYVAAFQIEAEKFSHTDNENIFWLKLHLKLDGKVGRFLHVRRHRFVCWPILLVGNIVYCWPTLSVVCRQGWDSSIGIFSSLWSLHYVIKWTCKRERERAVASEKRDERERARFFPWASDNTYEWVEASKI